MYWTFPKKYKSSAIKNMNKIVSVKTRIQRSENDKGEVEEKEEKGEVRRFSFMNLCQKGSNI